MLGTPERLEAIKINVPDWFARDDFQAWLNDKSKGIATWHYKGRPTESSDVFMTFDHGEGSDINDPDLPADIRDAIVQFCVDANMGYGVIWLTNLSDSEEPCYDFASRRVPWIAPDNPHDPGE